MALFDLSSSWLEGSHCPLAARGYSRDGKKGRLQIEYGLLTDPAGRPCRGFRGLLEHPGHPDPVMPGDAYGESTGSMSCKFTRTHRP